MPATANPFFQPDEQPIATANAAIDQELDQWQPLEVTLHDSAESLFSKLFDIRIRFESNEAPGQSIGAGALLLRDADRAQVLKTLGSRFDMDFSLADRRYALLAIRRTAGSVTHDSQQRGVFGFADREEMVAPAFDRNVAHLRPCLGPSRAVADTAITRQYLECQHKWGTHYVSRVWSGDVIYQVLSYDRERFSELQQALKASPESFSGPWAAFGFRYFSRPRQGQFGFVEQYSPLSILSQDPAFAASVASGQWRTTDWVVGDSILAPYLEQTVDLESFTRVVPIAVELSSLGLFIEHYRKLTWRHIYLAALSRKYGDAIALSFNPPADSLDSRLYAGEEDLLSTIASPRVRLFRRCFTPARMQLVASDSIEDLNVVSNLLTIDSDCHIPGRTVALLAFKINASKLGVGVPCLTLADQAFTEEQLWCQEFRGALQVKSASGKQRTLIVDGVRYDLVPDEASGHYRVTAGRDVCTPPPSSALPALRRGLEFAMVSAQALWQVEQVAPAEGVRERIQSLFEWLVTVIPGDTRDEELASLRLSALYQSRACGILTDASRRVPYLRYNAYRELVQSLIRVGDDISRTIQDYQARIRERQQLERVMDVATQLNANVVASGRLLADYITTSARQQDELAGLHSAIVEQDDQAIASTAASLRELDQLFSAQQMAVNQAVEHYQSAVADWQSREIVGFSLNLCLNLFKAGYTVITPVTPGKDGVTGLGETAKKVQKLVKSIAVINKVVQCLKGGIDSIVSAQQAMESIEGGDDTPISTLEWSEFGYNMKLALASGPSVVEKDALETAFDILVLRAQARLNATANAKKLIADRFLNLQRQKINQDQAARLQAMVADFKLAQISPRVLEGIDLPGLSAELQMQQQQMALTLASTLLLQDQSLQYEYQQQPLKLPSLDIAGLKLAIVRQHLQTIRALESLSPPPQLLARPIDYVVEGVPVDSLINGSVYRFRIALSAREFSPFTMMRVKDVTLHVEGVSASDSGSTISRLLYLGSPFEDRDQERRPMTFNAVSRQLEFLTDLQTGTVVFGGAAPAVDQISRITPFSTWEVSFPQVASNKGLAFTGHSVNLRLSFQIVAQLNDSPALEARLLSRDNAPEQFVTLEAAISRQSTLDNMAGRSVTKGWDVVLSLTEDKINKLLEQQYADRACNPDFVRQIPLVGFDYNTKRKTPPTPVTDPDAPYETGSDTIMRTLFSMTLGAPKISFMNNNSQYAEVTMEVLAGTYQSVVATGPDHSIITPLEDIPDITIHCETNPDTGVEICQRKPTFIKARVALAKVQGSLLSDIHQVVADLSKGAFSIDNFEINTTNPMFNSYLGQWFAGREVRYQLGALDTRPYATYDALNPRGFQFAVTRTNSGLDLLQLFITTDGKAQNTLSLDVHEPVPSGDDCSLIISSRIAYDKLLPQSLQNGGSFLQLAGINPGNDYTAWSGNFSHGLLPVSFDSGNSDIRLGADSNKVQIDFGGMRLTRNAAYELGISYSNVSTRSFQYSQQVCHRYIGSTSSWCENQWVNHSLEVTIDLNALLPVTVTGDDRNQQIRIALQSRDVQVNGHLSESGACSDRNMQSAFLDQLRAQLPGAIANALNVNFSDVSLFALENLLFPENDIIKFSSAYVPGDLIVFGTIAEALHPPTTSRT
ncbi:hypothetical protein [Pseudomonas sp.]|uniref:hypothetical protein n=1 Tax=Pseudomonas sp. TaxID=306 RepID=UPI003D6FCFCE